MLSVIKEEVLRLQIKRQNQQSSKIGISLGRTGQTLTSFLCAGFRHEIFFQVLFFTKFYFNTHAFGMCVIFFRARIEGHHYINQ